MDNLQRACVSLCIDEDHLVPTDITALLGREPRLGVRKGETFLASHGKYIQAKTGKWQFGGEWKSPVHLDEQISTLLNELTDDIEIWTNLTGQYHCYLSVGGYFDGWTGGITLEAETLKALGDRGLAIDFDLYAPAASD